MSCTRPHAQAGLMPSRFAQRLLTYRSEAERNLLLVLETERRMLTVALAPFDSAPLQEATARFNVQVTAIWLNAPNGMRAAEAYTFGRRHVAFAMRERLPGLDVAERERWSARTGWELVRADAQLFSPVRIANAKLIHAHLNTVPADELQHALREAALAAMGPVTWDDLAWAGRFAGYRDAEVRSGILHLIGYGWLRCDLEEALTPNVRLTWWVTALGMRQDREREARSHRRRGQRRRTSG